MTGQTFIAIPDYTGDKITATRDGFTLSLALERDGDASAPWESEDGHGPVSDWRRKGWNGYFPKAPGELLLCDDNTSGLRGNSSARFYDFAAACRIALRDGWGVPAYRLDHSCNANGFYTVSAQWFHGGELLSFEAIGDDLNAAIHEVYCMHRDTFPSARAYAAAAARADYDRLAAWCADQWEYVGVIVTASRNGIDLASVSLWGAESDAADYLLEVANELASEAISEARDAIESLAA